MDIFNFSITKEMDLTATAIEQFNGKIEYPTYCKQIVSTTLKNKDLWLFAGFPTTPPNRHKISDLKTFKEEILSLNGPFFSLYLDRNSKRIILITDRLGIFPVYWKIDNQRIQFSNKIIPLTTKPNLASWGAFYAYGCPIGNNTLAEGVERLPAASCITIDLMKLKLSTDTYWNWPDRVRKASVDEVYEALISDLKAVKPLLTNPSILLSGGFDSRLLAYSLSQLNIKPNAIIVSHADELMDLDRKYALQVASKLELTTFLNYPEDDFFQSEKYLNYLKASDAETPSLDLFIPKVFQFVPAGEIFEGLVPGYTIPLVHQPPGGPSKYLECDSIVNHRESKRWQLLKYIFGEQTLSEMWDGFIEQTQNEISKYEDSDHGTMQFICSNKMRNRTSINPFKVYAEKSIPMGICFSHDFLDSISQLHYEDRNNANFYKKLLKSKFPESQTTPVISGGIRYPLETTIIRKTVESIQESVYYWSTMHPSIGKYLLANYSDQRKQMQNREHRINTLLTAKVREGQLKSSKEHLCSLSVVEKSSILKFLYHWNIWNSLKNDLPETGFLKEYR